MYRSSGVRRVKLLPVFRAVFDGLYRDQIISDIKPFTPTGRRRTEGGTGSNGHKITIDIVYCPAKHVAIVLRVVLPTGKVSTEKNRGIFRYKTKGRKTRHLHIK